MSLSFKKICYLGIYQPTAPRDKIYLEGFKRIGSEVILCVDNSPRFSKFFRLAEKLRSLKNQYDILWVGYLSTMVVPLARLISRKRIVYNALDSCYDRSILDRGMHLRFSPKAIIIWFSDFLAFHLSHTVLVESEQQKLFIAKNFFVNKKKLTVVFTGVDETVFHPDISIKKSEKFTVVFRGMFLPATGVEYVIETARLLKNEDIQFRIIGWGQPLQNKLKKMIADGNLSKVNLTTVFLPPDELRRTLLSAHVMLGQFGNHPRMERTIQHKTSEAMALGMPYITRDSASNRELLTDGVNCLFVPPADPKAIAEKILLVMKNETLRQTLAIGARRLFEDRLSSEILSASAFSVVVNENSGT